MDTLNIARLTFAAVVATLAASFPAVASTGTELVVSAQRESPADLQSHYDVEAEAARALAAIRSTIEQELSVLAAAAISREPLLNAAHAGPAQAERLRINP
jgi:Asp/Glu/hydantoin racemase